MYNLVEGCLYSKTLNLASVESRSILRRGAGGYKGDQDIVLDLKELDTLRGKNRSDSRYHAREIQMNCYGSLRREGKVLESGITDDEKYQGSFI